MENNPNCPISTDRIDENIVRVTAFFVIIAAALVLYFKSFLLMFILGLDFALRAFTAGDCSPVRLLSKRIVKLMRLKERPIDSAPKKFAAELGMAFCIIIGTSLILKRYMFADIFGGILILCAFLEGAFAFCVGCLVYTRIVLPFYGQK